MPLPSSKPAAHLEPWADQWAFLASINGISRVHIEGIVQEAERGGRVLGVRLPPQEDEYDEPWTAPPSRRRKELPILGTLPQAVQLVLGNQIYIDKEGLHPALRNRLVRLAAFQNPEFYKAQAMRLSTAKAQFVAGLSATVARKDGHHPIIFMQCGPVRHRVNAKAQAASRPFEHLVIVSIVSRMNSPRVFRTSWSCERGWERGSGKASLSGWQPSHARKHGSSWQLASTSERVSTTPDWTRCF